MVDRIEKTDRTDYWKIASTKETKEEKKEEDQKHSGQEPKDSFGESSDFVQLLSKDPRKYSSEKLAASQISGFTFRGISTHREKAILEVDISMSNGTLIRGAQVAVSRAQGMQYISRRPGEEIVVDQIVKGSILAVAIPQAHRPDVPVSRPAPATPGQAKAKSGSWQGMGWYYVLGFGALMTAILLLIYLFFPVKAP